MSEEIQAQKYILTCIYDTKSKLNFAFQEFRTVVDAVRHFEQVIRHEHSMQSKYKGDFECRKVGFVDIDSGFVEPLSILETIAYGVHYITDDSPKSAA